MTHMPLVVTGGLRGRTDVARPLEPSAKGKTCYDEHTTGQSLKESQKSRGEAHLVGVMFTSICLSPMEKMWTQFW